MPTPFNFPGDFANSPTAINGGANLDGRPYRFRFWPNSRSGDGQGAWLVDLYTATGVPSLVGLKLVLTDDLYADFRTAVPEVPPGRIVVRRTDSVDAEPRPPRKVDGVQEIGTRIATLGSPLLVVEYVSTAEDALTT